ncbi:hypothetical protein JHD50_05445, partial [Sulfurimonas sp. MAG313]
RRGHQFARYADDFIILVQSLRAGKRVLDSVTKFVNQQLKLKVNEHKSQVVPIKKSKFFGFAFNGKWLKWHPTNSRAHEGIAKRHKRCVTFWGCVNLLVMELLLDILCKLIFRLN